MSPRTAVLGDFTAKLFGLVPVSVVALVLRFTLAMPFWKSGMTKWDGWFTLSFGAQALFSEDFKLHLFGAEYPFPAPVAMAYASAIGETVLPVLLVLGLGTRYAALGVLAMTAIIQLTVPDGWETYHLPWAAMALAILCLGPGKLGLDRWIGVER